MCLCYIICLSHLTASHPSPTNSCNFICLTLSYCLLSCVFINIQLPILEVIEWLRWRQSNSLHTTNPLTEVSWVSSMVFDKILFSLNMKTITAQCSVTVGLMFYSSITVGSSWLANRTTGSQYVVTSLANMLNIYILLKTTILHVLVCI